jgi:hypothetical protein
MANVASTASDPQGAALVIDLKDRRLAAFLAWLWPGLGHIYQRRTGKGVLFFICIFGTFLFGLLIGGGRVVYASGTNPVTRTRQFFERWHYVCQLGVGLPALPAFVQTWRVERGKQPLFDFLRPPKMAAPADAPFESKDKADNTVIHPHELAQWHYDLGDRFEMGTVFTVIAGLLNILAICDAYGGPLVITPREGKKQPEKKTS